MKILKYLTGVVIVLLFTACSSKELVLHKPLYDFNIEKNSIITKEDKVVKYDITAPDAMTLGWGPTWETVKDSVTNNTTFTNINDDGSMILCSFSLKDTQLLPKHHKLELVVPGLQALLHEMERRDVEYFQIIAPFSLSNENGFPINNVEDLSTYLVPELSNPEDDDAEIVYEESMHPIYFENVVQHNFLSPMADYTVKIIVKTIKNPTPDQIVWDVKKI